MDCCRLCGQTKPLLESHILPEFVYRPAYDDMHTAIQLDIDKGKRSKRQKGFVERLLCAECEHIFSTWENYFSRIWLHPSHRIRPQLPNRNVVVEIPGIDYVRFKLFQLSIIWRAGVSSCAEFRNVDLGTHEVKIRKCLNAGDPGDPDKYPLICFALRDPLTEEFYDKILRAPEAARLYGQHFYSMIYGGVVWTYVISNHRDSRIEKVNCFRRDGILKLAVQDWTENPSVIKLAKHIQGKMS